MLNKNIKTLGFIENADDYFKNYRFAFVSGYLSILEAMANKRLVFAVNDNPLKEDYLKMSPFAEFIIIEKDPASLAEKVNYYLNNPKKENEMINKAYKWSTLQSWENLLNIYFKLWNLKK